MPGSVDAASAQRLEPLAAGGRVAPERVAQEFEALILAELWKQAAPREGGLLDGGSAGRMYRDLLMQELAQRMAQRGGFGLARTLGEELQRGSAASEEPSNDPGGSP